jgi:hypothetical protein
MLQLFQQGITTEKHGCKHTTHIVSNGCTYLLNHIQEYNKLEMTSAHIATRNSQRFTAVKEMQHLLLLCTN